MTLNSQGMPSLMYGHLTGKFSCDYDQFTLDTPLGRMNLSGEASIGVIAAANKVELHVFAGTATLKLWAMGISGTSSQLTASAGTALSASSGSGWKRRSRAGRSEGERICNASRVGSKPSAHYA